MKKTGATRGAATRLAESRYCRLPRRIGLKVMERMKWFHR
eukprot:COSAG03_NODE_129_length_12045_cov_19.842625_6_plen_40_part_00